MIIELFLWALLIVFSPVILLCGIATLIIALMFLLAILVGIGLVLLKFITIVLHGIQRARNKKTNDKVQEYGSKENQAD